MDHQITRRHWKTCLSVWRMLRSSGMMTSVAPGAGILYNKMSAAAVHLRGSVDQWYEQKMSKQQLMYWNSGTMHRNSVKQQTDVWRSVSGGGEWVFGHKEVGSHRSHEAQLDVKPERQEAGREQWCCLRIKWRRWLYKVRVFLFLISKVVFTTSECLCLGNRHKQAFPCPWFNAWL